MSEAENTISEIASIRTLCSLCYAVDKCIVEGAPVMENIQSVANYNGMQCGAAETKIRIARDFLSSCK